MPHQAPQIKQNQKRPRAILTLEKAINLVSRFDSSRAEWGVTEISKDLDTDPEHRKKTLDQIRGRGYALDNEEFNGGWLCVAAPIKNYSQKIIGGIGISGSINRIHEENLEKLICVMKKTAQKISRRLGFGGNSPERRRR